MINRNQATIIRQNMLFLIFARISAHIMNPRGVNLKKTIIVNWSVLTSTLITIRIFFFTGKTIHSLIRIVCKPLATLIITARRNGWVYITKFTLDDRQTCATGKAFRPGNNHTSTTYLYICRTFSKGFQQIMLLTYLLALSYIFLNASFLIE